MLFTPEHADWILGRSPHTGLPKTETRRDWKRWRVRVGGTYFAATRLFDADSRFARIFVLRRWLEPLREMSHDSVVREGYADRGEYLAVLAGIMKIPVGGLDMDRPLYVVRFIQVGCGNLQGKGAGTENDEINLIPVERRQ